MTRDEFYDLKEQLEVLESEQTDLENEEKGPEFKKVFDYITAETFYVKGGFTLEAIASFMARRIKPDMLLVWHQEFKWNEKRRAYLEKNKEVTKEAKELVTMALIIAKTDPSSINITSYKRAIEALVSLEKSDKNNEEEEEAPSELTKEKIDEFAVKAGLR